jgi:thioredoxin-related protein
MRRIFSISILLFATIILKANNENIQFVDASWSETTSKAKENGKYVFLDCYTDWCYWCKVMDKETFMDTSVTNLINSRFVPARREMEKSDEGKALSMKYHVNGYPTYLVFDGSGQLVYQIVGYHVAAEFKSELNKALQSETPLYPGLSAQLDPGFPEFYKNSFGTSKERKKADEKTVSEFLDKQADLFSEVSWSVMWRFTLNEKYETWVMENRVRLTELYGMYEVDDKIMNIFSSRNNRAAENKDEAAYTANLVQMQTMYPELAAGGYTLNFSQTYYQKTGDWKRYAAITQNYIDTAKGTHDGFVNSCAWTVYESCKDKDVIKQAIVWMDTVCARTEEYAYEDTYAAILYAGAQYKKSEQVALHAIDLGKTAGEDVSGTEALLANVRLKIK